ncbi:16S rRNA (uracil(1498)-N(3))-methyltransferase [Desertivirga arenae]|uniref:16S rRNA (uracil(1498)-N(3))-methyltransferase n=1 Tax=Desertivirga arenae TaxID=2810309 RepID=UPI001A978CAC|nr:16S rRNA (uracil(1498)-N(3))-methyltransferase [Pedobacter sp. SYSU D00823]
MHLFYTPDVNGENYTLNEEESKHCIRVLRLVTKDVVHLIDGKGGFYTAEIIDPNPKRTTLLITDVKREFNRRNHFLHIAVAPTKNIERIEWFLEKATEIGIDEITPILCDRSERKEIKLERLNRIITSAVKQSLKAYHPKLNPLTKYSDFVGSAGYGNKFIAHCLDEPKLELRSAIQLEGHYTVLIGPEGDFTGDEIELAKSNDFKAITLGSSRLRTETAALEACFEVNFLNR